MNIIDLSYDPSNRYTLLSGLTGGLFLFISYFGTDQSQVQRYLGGKSLRASRMGLMFNGLVKIPMQFFILFIGVMVFVSFQFNKPPVTFNEYKLPMTTEQAAELKAIEDEYDAVFEQKKNLLIRTTSEVDDQAVILQQGQDSLRTAYKAKLFEIDPNYEENDKDYIFLSFILDYLPHGLIGLLLAVIFSAAMSSIASELNALASCTTVDFYKRSWNPNQSDKHYLNAAKGFTLAWGGIALMFAAFASLFDNLIEFVNIVGSLFYGTILGVFLVGFFFKKVKSKAVLFGAIIGEIVVLTIFALDHYEVISLAYLWLNFLGCAVVILISILLQSIFREKELV